MNLTGYSNTKIAFFFLIVLFVSACTKIVSTDIGSGLIPPVDGVQTKDTVLDVITKNAGFDTAAVGLSDDHVVGYTNDPVFGTTTASLNFQVEPTSFPFSFGDDEAGITLDSVVLSLSYKGIWGDSTLPLAMRVYQMDNENIFSPSYLYYTTTSFEKGQEITENGSPASVNLLTLNDPDTTAHYREVADYTLRIRLNKSFGQQLIHFTGTDAYTNDSTFHNYLRGIIVQPEQQGNALVDVNLLDTSTHLSLYYRFTDSTGKIDTAYRRFSPQSSTSASSNTIIRNYQDKNITPVPSLNQQDSLLYIQTSPGIYSTVSIPGLAGLQNMTIHRAELLMEQVPDITSASDAAFTPPSLFLSAYRQDTLKRFAIPNDISYYGSGISNLSTFGVYPVTKYDASTARNIASYNFELTRYVQGIVTRKDSVYNLALWAPYNEYVYPAADAPYSYPISTPALNTVGIGRVRIGGGNNIQHKMRLHIVYSLP